jgi:hypothetical protein
VDDKWQKIQCQAFTQFARIFGLSSKLDIPKKLHSGRVMISREMTPMYIPNSDF